ncbi:hypothetical protein [Bordetella petrii]|uniref:hypothetical protein n=1 Tax=Bordetella petrii TaxID=94624 RepID=UPI00047E6472|nr:hypothetical protein [Bordetella petrii]
MRMPRSVLQPLVAALACACLAACADSPPRQTDIDYRSRPARGTPAPDGTAQGASQQRLTIQSGEGEKLNLPWFIRDAQDWVNTH